MLLILIWLTSILLLLSIVERLLVRVGIICEVAIRLYHLKEVCVLSMLRCTHYWICWGIRSWGAGAPHPAARNVKENRRVFYGASEKKRYNIYVARISCDEYRNSRPCSHCLKNLKMFAKISKVYYTLGDGMYACEKVRDMTSEHISNGFRHLMRQKCITN